MNHRYGFDIEYSIRYDNIFNVNLIITQMGMYNNVLLERAKQIAFHYLYTYSFSQFSTSLKPVLVFCRCTS